MSLQSANDRVTSNGRPSSTSSGNKSSAFRLSLLIDAGYAVLVFVFADRFHSTDQIKPIARKWRKWTGSLQNMLLSKDRNKPNSSVGFFSVERAPSVMRAWRRKHRSWLFVSPRSFFKITNIKKSKASSGGNVPVRSLHILFVASLSSWRGNYRSRQQGLGPAHGIPTEKCVIW